MDAFSIERRIMRELGSGEKLLWSGQPKQGFMLRSTDAAMIPFSLLWCGFAVFWEAMVIRIPVPWFFKLWGIPFIAVGLYMVVGRFAVDVFKRQKTAYGVTNERIIIISGLLLEAVESLNVRTLPAISLSESGDGTGTITLGQSPTFFSQFNTWQRSSRYNPPPALERIEQSRHVYNLILQGQRQTAELSR
jgi:hypothetical protein